MINYGEYTKARDKAWETLIDTNIKSLPVDLSAVANRYKIKVILYSKTMLYQALSQEAKLGDGFTVKEEGTHKIYLNDKVLNRYRRRFTLAHEIGHILLGHVLEELVFRNNEIDYENDRIETEANIFARDLLAPAIVLKELDVHTPKEIMDLCHISDKSAKIRAERMEVLYKRNAWERHHLERKVKAQFKDYIDLKKQTQ